MLFIIKNSWWNPAENCKVFRVSMEELKWRNGFIVEHPMAETLILKKGNHAMIWKAKEERQDFQQAKLSRDSPLFAGMSVCKRRRPQNWKAGHLEWVLNPSFHSPEHPANGQAFLDCI